MMNVPSCPSVPSQLVTVLQQSHHSLNIALLVFLIDKMFWKGKRKIWSHRRAMTKHNAFFITLVMTAWLTMMLSFVVYSAIEEAFDRATELADFKDDKDKTKKIEQAKGKLKRMLFANLKDCF